MADNERTNIMNKFPIISLLIMVITFIAAVFISREMRQMRFDIYDAGIAEARMEMKYFPVLGMDKFYADIEWIRLIQQMGDPNITMKYDEKSKNSALFFYNKLDKITTLSPDINKPYLIGARHISNVVPKKSVALLEKADKLSSKTNWRNYEYIAFVKKQYVAPKLESEEEKNKIYEEAANNYRIAMDMPDSPSYIESAWLRLQAKLQGLTDDDFGRFSLEYNYLVEKNSMMTGTAEGDDDMAADSSMITEDSDLLDKIMGDARNLAIDLWKKAQKADPATRKKLMETHAKVKEMFFNIAPNGHYSMVSLYSYGPGEKFDVHTGTPVDVYGICPVCKADGRTTVVKGKFCHICGTKQDKK